MVKIEVFIWLGKLLTRIIFLCHIRVSPITFPLDQGTFRQELTTALGSRTICMNKADGKNL